MDKKFLKENNLLEAHKQFMRLCEWSYTPIEEDDENPTDNNVEMEDPNQVQDTGNEDVQNGENGIESGSMNQMPDQNGMGDQNMDNTDMGMQGQVDMNQQDNVAQGQPMDVDFPQDDEEVIDVDDLTNAQEKMNTKVNRVGHELGSVDDKISTLLASLDKMEQMIDNNNQEIIKFKQEFEKRNPTQTEKLNLRSLDSYPFNINPKDYWDEKGLDPNSHYSGYGDNDKSTTDEYVITNNDVDNFDERSISQSFNIDDDLNQDIKKIFGL